MKTDHAMRCCPYCGAKPVPWEVSQSFDLKIPSIRCAKCKGELIETVEIEDKGTFDDGLEYPRPVPSRDPSRPPRNRLYSARQIILPRGKVGE